MWLIEGQTYDNATEAASLFRPPWDLATLRMQFSAMQPGDRVIVNNTSIIIKLSGVTRNA